MSETEPYTTILGKDSTGVGYDSLRVGDREIGRIYLSGHTGKWCGYNPRLGIGQMVIGESLDSVARHMIEQDRDFCGIHSDEVAGS